MNQRELAIRIKERLDRLAQKYDTKGEQLLYEQGILLGMIASLALNDSQNFDLIIAKFKELESRN